MSMLSERLQILISPDQRRRLEAEAQRRGSSVATLVREAIDASLARPTRAERLEAVEAIKAMKGTYLPVEELEAIVDEERDRNFPLVEPD
jgi:predicted transcriptional regulator